ncbi:MAG: hypothetical protein ACRD8O_12375 [Bryobacteraceae bacterium]
MAIVAGKPGLVMLLQEAALRACAPMNLPLLARPTCMALPAVLGGGVAASSGCIGNRTYTEIQEDELYVAVSGKDLARVVDQLATIVAANQALAGYHRARRETIATA